MHILILSQIFPPDMGGTPTRAFNVAKSLVSNGVKVTVIAGVPHYPTGDVPKNYRWKPLVEEQMGEIRVLRTFIPPLSSTGLTNRLVLFVSFVISSIFPIPFIGHVDGVFASNPQIISFFPAKFYGLINRCPVILNVDDLWPENLYDLGMLKSKTLRRFCEIIAKVAYSVADAITPISPDYIETIFENYGTEKGKMFFIPSGADLRFFKSPPSLLGRKKEFRVLYIGTFSPAYDFEQILQAAKLLKDEEKIKFSLQGRGEMSALVKSRITVLDLKNVELIERIVSREDVAKIMMAADALLLPLSGMKNVDRGISSKLYEYQAASKPIICCSNGTSARYISKTNSGIVVKPGDLGDLTKAILYLKENPLIAMKLGKSGRKYVEENLSINKIGLKMKTIFEVYMNEN